MRPRSLTTCALVAIAFGLVLGSAGCSAEPPDDDRGPPATLSKPKKQLSEEQDEDLPAKRDEEPELTPVTPSETPPPNSGCHAETLPASAVSSDYDGSFATPLGVGGTLQDATYELTAWSKFKGHTSSKVQQRREKLVVSGGGRTAVRVRQTDGGTVERTSFSIALNGMTSRLVFTQTCPAGSATAVSYSYRAINDDLTLYDTSANEGYDFTR